MKRIILATFAVTTVCGSTLAASAAFGAPPNRTSLALTCDRGVDRANVSVWVQQAANAPAGPYTLSCGSDTGSRSDRTVQLTTSKGVGIDVAAFYVTTSEGVMDCSGISTLPAKVPCINAAGEGATLVAR